ncbi:hypothetical protein K466DRAFT_558153 [Polyporus arcularius HHB13444]|uniref:Uncharacterized protein n=1 Tax=Polyporus arcularius HHB13444 TaxID=1314778 RepID=A0A5C3NXY6_9APHY|nr:hypothetical protein K466DRAFT_558153 [Polyporus arcularius HHB13444]
MSLTNLARRLRNKARSKADSADDSATNSSRSSLSRGGFEPPATSNGTTRGPTSVQMPEPIPARHPPARLSIPVPGPATPATVSPSTPRPHAMDGALAELTTMPVRLSAGPALRSVDRALDSLGNKAENYAPHTNIAMSVINNASQAATTIEQSEIGKKIERSIQRFADDVPWLMKGLDELARIHPVVTVAVLAFKAVYALETTRQENDRRVITLYVEMKDMMMVMVQLKGIDNRTHIGLDGRMLKDRLEELAEQTAKDIKECANFCDTFLKKKLLVKVLKGPVWAEKLAGFVQVFNDRKDDFQFALAMHTANSLTEIKRQNKDISAKLEVVIGLFSRLVSPEEQKIAAEVESRGGPNKIRVMDDATLKSLIALEVTVRGGPEDKEDIKRAKQAQEKQPGTIRRGKAEMTTKKAMTLDELKMELREDVDDALEKNFETFIGKFELQVSMLQIALERYIRTENDRVIGVVKDVMTQGPHMKIKDPELRKIWQDMGWRGNVKARLFVMTLQDHYRDLFDHTVAGPGDPVASDEWALEFLNMAWLEPIMEAFDDDASGYVTIAEVNKLMDMRPPNLNWSIPHWLAYWAIGWKIGASMHASRILILLSLMRDAVPKVLPRNRSAVDNYFVVWWWIGMMIAGLQNSFDAELNTPSYRFQEYIDMEEARLRGNLERIKYNIDASDTLTLVMGTGGLEKNTLPLICLLLENDWKKIQAAQSVILTSDEFTKSQGNVGQIMNAIQRRVKELNGLYLQQKLDIKEQFSKHSYGLFQHYRPDTEFWDLTNSHNSLFTYSVVPPVQDGPPDIEGMELEKEPPVDTTLYDTVDEATEEDLTAPESLRPVLGQWYGFAYSEQLYPTRTMLSPHFHYTVERNAATTEDFHGTGIEFDGDRFDISGTVVHSPDGTVFISWTLSYVGDFNIFYTGRLVDERTILGTRSYDLNPTSQDWSFVLKKLPAEDLPFYPSPRELSENKYRALWGYAINVTLNNVRRRLWTWSYFVQRREARKTYVELTWDMVDRPSPDHDSRMSAIGRMCTPKDVRFYDSITVNLLHTIPLHYDPGPCCNYFDNNHPIRGARYICIDCLQEPFFQQVTFCDRDECYRRFLPKFAVPGLTKAHYATHALIKIRTIVHRLEWPHLRDRAIAARDLLRVHPLPTPPTLPVGLVGGRLTPPPVPFPPMNPPIPSSFAGHIDDDDNGFKRNQSPDAIAGCTEGPVDMVNAKSADMAEMEDPKRPLEMVNATESRITPSGANHIDTRMDVEAEAHPVVESSSLQSRRSQDGSGDLEPPTAPPGVDSKGGTETELNIEEHPSMHVDRVTARAALEPDGVPNQREQHVLPPPLVMKRASSAGSSPPSPVPQACRICAKSLNMHRSWWCLNCWAPICDDCECKLLIGCWSCGKRFSQPTWYYGFSPNTDFICDMCCARGVKGPDPNYSEPYPPHNYTHPLLLVEPWFPDPPEAPSMSEERLTESRLARLEQQISVMDAKFEQLQAQLARMESQLQLNVAKAQEEMQRALLAKFTETLEKALGARSNGHA